MTLLCVMMPQRAPTPRTSGHRLQLLPLSLVDVSHAFARLPRTPRRRGRRSAARACAGSGACACARMNASQGLRLTLLGSSVQLPVGITRWTYTAAYAARGVPVRPPPHPLQWRQPVMPYHPQNPSYGAPPFPQARVPPRPPDTLPLNRTHPLWRGSASLAPQLGARPAPLLAHLVARVRLHANTGSRLLLLRHVCLAVFAWRRGRRWHHSDCKYHHCRNTSGA
jgi:hypothetical protein